MKGLPFVLAFTAMTFIAWGAYGPVLHHGNKSMGGNDAMRAFVGVGLAYFFIAVLVPIYILRKVGENGKWTVGGTFYSLVAGGVGAIGALGVILALSYGGNTVYVMPLVFGFAPIVNTLVTAWMSKTFDQIKPVFIFGIVMAAVGAGGVVAFKPVKPHANTHTEEDKGKEKKDASTTGKSSPIVEQLSSTVSGKIVEQLSSTVSGPATQQNSRSASNSNTTSSTFNSRRSVHFVAFPAQQPQDDLPPVVVQPEPPADTAPTATTKTTAPVESPKPKADELPPVVEQPSPASQQPKATESKATEPAPAIASQQPPAPVVPEELPPVVVQPEPPAMAPAKSVATVETPKPATPVAQPTTVAETPKVEPPKPEPAKSEPAKTALANSDSAKPSDPIKPNDATSKDGPPQPATDSASKERAPATDGKAVDTPVVNKTEKVDQKPLALAASEVKQPEKPKAEKAEPPKATETVAAKESGDAKEDSKSVAKPAAAPNVPMIIVSIIIAALCWGSYGPMLHQGQARMAGSRLRPFTCVGISYFIIAVAAPLALIANRTVDNGSWTGTGIAWSIAAGTAGALGALGVILAFNAGGKPYYVMPLVFGFAPVINTSISLTENGTWNSVNIGFWISLAVVIAGAITVLTNAPKPKPH